ncbi:hypothetical protein ACMHYB_49995 [Sorangium sp. So ce1128]
MRPRSGHTPRRGAGLGEKAREALVLRNKVIGLLSVRLSTVRAAARFVFRDRPDIVREATSAYERRRRAESARRAKKKVDAPLPLLHGCCRGRVERATA